MSKLLSCVAEKVGCCEKDSIEYVWDFSELPAHSVLLRLVEAERIIADAIPRASEKIPWSGGGIGRLEKDGARAAQGAEFPHAALQASGIAEDEQNIEIGDAPPSAPLLTDDSQIGANLRVCADEEDRTDFDQRI